VDVDTTVLDQGQLRKYEINKMKYFYAVVHCNTRHTAERLYNEYNDYEFELSNIRLNLSFIADDLKFPQ
jgi:flavodoxin